METKLSAILCIEAKAAPGAAFPGCLAGSKACPTCHFYPNAISLNATDLEQPDICGNVGRIIGVTGVRWDVDRVVVDTGTASVALQAMAVLALILGTAPIDSQVDIARPALIVIARSVGLAAWVATSIINTASACRQAVRMAAS